MILNCFDMYSLFTTCILIYIQLLKITSTTAEEYHDAAGALNLIRSRGFIAEYYSIQTRGYPLTLYRIINPLADQARLNRYPVLYGHGIMFDSISMIARSERARPRKPVLGKPTIKFANSIDQSDDYSLPFMLSNNNFDVWLFDAKGTNDNNRNETLLNNFTEAQKFWDFSLDDEALSDLPLLIDFVLLKTQSKKLVYVGYSQTTLFLFALLSTAPRYSDKLVAIVCMAPVAYSGNVKGLTIDAFELISTLIPDFVQNNYMPQSVIEAIDMLLKNACTSQSFSSLVCGTLVNGFGGKGVGENSPEFYKRFFKSTSLKVIRQLAQLHTGKRFGMYDYGSAGNMRRYNQTRPPAYDLARITSDRFIFVRGLSDLLSNPQDTSILLSEMGTKPYRDIVIPQYNHFDFIDGKDLIRLVNAPAVVAIYELMYREASSVLRSPLSILSTIIVKV